MSGSFDFTQVEGNLNKYADTADARVAEFEEVLGRLATRFESILAAVGRIVSGAKQKRDQVYDLADQAFGAVKPVVSAVQPAASKTKAAGQKLARRYREDPTPFLVGGALVLGGVLLTAYYLNSRSSEEEARFADRTAEEESGTFAANAS